MSIDAFLKPSDHDQVKCEAIRAMARTGRKIVKEDVDFMLEVQNKFPEWYSACSPRIQFSEPVPKLRRVK